MKQLTNFEHTAGATFSDCMAYRYALWREIPGTYVGQPTIAFIGLNPSTATHEETDPTVTRCRNRAKALGYHTFYMLNLFPIRSTDPRGMLKHDMPGGDQIEHEEFITPILQLAKTIICCWGNHGSHMDQDEWMKQLLEREAKSKTFALAVSKGGHPKHPLYLPMNLEPFPWPKR